MKTYVFDANAILILMLDRPGASRVVKILREADRQASRVFMSAVNWGEVVYSLCKVRGESETKRLLLRVEQLPMAVVAVDRERASRAAELKARHGLGYADSFAASLALEMAAMLVTADPEFHKIGKKLKVNLLPPHSAASSF